jgi:DNA polymerase IV
MPSQPRTILHVDMDAFYASVEQRDDPSLRGRPLIVGGTGPRGVVAAASYEVRRFGVRSAMPMREALKRCPEAICVRPRMARYVEVSRQVFALFARFTPDIEGLSLDEAFLDVTASRALHGDGEQIARAIKAGIAATTTLTASVGVAQNKLVAKIASDLNKPDGLCVVAPGEETRVLDPLPVTRLPGLGRKLGEAVRAAGIATLGELRRASDAQLWPLFGRDAQYMRDRASGRDERSVSAEREEVSISAEETFDGNVRDDGALLAALLKQADRVGERLRRRRLVAGCLTLKLREPDFRTVTRRRSFTPASSDGAVLAQLTRELFTAWRGSQPGVSLRLVGVAASDLAPGEQADLFAPPAETAVAEPKLDAAVDEIRRRFGSAALQRGGNLRERGSKGP